MFTESIANWLVTFLGDGYLVIAFGLMPGVPLVGLIIVVVIGMYFFSYYSMVLPIGIVMDSPYLNVMQHYVSPLFQQSTLRKFFVPVYTLDRFVRPGVWRSRRLSNSELQEMIWDPELDRK